MKLRCHPELTLEKWNRFSVSHQILNIASELLRARQWMPDPRMDYFRNSVERALELIDLTAASAKKPNMLGELLRLREVLASFYLRENFSEADIREFILLMQMLVDFDPEAHLIKDSLAA